MPSLTARLIASLFRMTGSLRKRYSDGPDFLKFIEQSRVEQQYPDAKMRKRLDVRESTYEGRKIFRIAPRDARQSGLVRQDTAFRAKPQVALPAFQAA